MTKTEKKKKVNRQDLTLRNLRALKKLVNHNLVLLRGKTEAQFLRISNLESIIAKRYKGRK